METFSPQKTPGFVLEVRHQTSGLRKTLTGSLETPTGDRPTLYLEIQGLKRTLLYNRLDVTKCLSLYEEVYLGRPEREGWTHGLVELFRSGLRLSKEDAKKAMAAVLELAHEHVKMLQFHRSKIAEATRMEKHEGPGRTQRPAQG
jgi:hypothetical protein